MDLFWFGRAEVQGLRVCGLMPQQLLYSYHLNYIKFKEGQGDGNHISLTYGNRHK